MNPRERYYSDDYFVVLYLWHIPTIASEVCLTVVDLNRNVRLMLTTLHHHRWMSPESLMDGVWGIRSDAWMLGVALWGESCLYFGCSRGTFERC
jgi:hypothetical protein